MNAHLDEIRFQQRLLQNPSVIDDEMKVYLEAHPEKFETVKQAKQFEERLMQVLDVPVPEGLQARILMRNTFESAQQTVDDSQKTPRAFWQQSLGSWAMIAASFLVVSIGFMTFDRSLNLEESSSSIAQIQAVDMENAVIEHIIAHAKEQPEILAKNAPEPSEKDLQRIFKYVGATLHKPIDFMSYAGDCEVDGEKGLHIVLQEEEGPVTIIVLPHRQLNGMVTFAQDGMKGQMIPVKGGVVAIVGATDKQLVMAQMHFFKAVSFS